MHMRQRFAGWQPWTIATLVLASAAVLYMLTSSWPDTPDGLFHLHRVRALAEALRMGVLYPRWFPDFAFGYGYPVLNFYAPAFYYPAALLHLAGLDLIASIGVILSVSYALSGLAAYALLRRWTRPLPAILGAVLYLVYPYRFYDLFVRGALPEFAAFFWLPLIALTTVRWLEVLARTRSDRSASRRLDGLVPIVLSWAGLILTHNLTALMAGVAALFFAGLLAGLSVFAWVRGTRGDIKRAVPRCCGYGSAALLLPPVLGAGLSAPYMLPALLETGWVGIGMTAEGHGYAAHFAALRALFDHALVYQYPDAAQPTVPVPSYVVVILILAVVVLLLPPARGRSAVLGSTVGLAVFALWLSTASSAFLWDGLAEVLGRLQFPWRWQTIVALALACTLGLTLDIGGGWLAAARVPRVGQAFAVVLGAYLVFQACAGLDYLPAPYLAGDLTTGQMWAFDAEHGQIGATWAGEFLPRWVSEQRWAIGQESSSGPTATTADQVLSVGRSGHVFAQSYLGERLSYDASTSSQLIFHVFYYPAWRVEVDGQPLSTYPVGDLGLLAVDLPAGQHEVTRRWGATPAVWAGRAVGVMGWLLLGLLMLARDRRFSLSIGLWLLAAGLAVVGSSGWLAQEQPAAPVIADYESVRLESAVVIPGRVGETVQVTLHWLVTATPEPLTAFVHVVASDGAPDGRMVLGDDAPLGGLYTPASRWLIGEMLRDVRTLALPADLPPGTYLLKAGLYRPGQSATPLIPVGADSAASRVDVGVLEVRP